MIHQSLTTGLLIASILGVFRILKYLFSCGGRFSEERFGLACSILISITLVVSLHSEHITLDITNLKQTLATAVVATFFSEVIKYCLGKRGYE